MFDQFSERHIGVSNPAELQKMLDVIGVRSIDELLSQVIPQSIRLKKPLALPEKGMSEYEFAAHIRALADRNRCLRSFIGMGYYPCAVPAAVSRNVFENPAWYTSYTPYQAEISQGRLEALLNFQTAVISLTGMEIGNCSLLDEGTAAAEAMLMMFSLRSREAVREGRNQLFVDRNLFPQTLDVLLTRSEPFGIELIVDDYDEYEFTGREFGAVVQYPAADGAVRDYADFTAAAHARGALVTAVCDLLALALLAGTVPMASAASADLTYDVDEDSGVWLDADDFQEIYEDDNGGYLEYVEFTDYDDFDDYGYFTFEDFDRYGFDDVDSKALENYEFYYDRADADDYDIDLDTLRFETYDNIDSDTLDFDVRLYGDEGSFYATVRIDVEGGSRSGSGDVELTYKVDPGDDVTVDAEDFWDLFDEEDGRYDELEYVEFTSYDDFDDFGYFGADGYDSDDYIPDYELNDSDLDDAMFYYDENDVWYDYDFELDTLTFYADRNADADTLAFDFTMHGVDGDKVYGTLYIEVGKGSGTSSKGDLTYQVDPDDDVTLDAEDFYDFFYDESDYDELEYVEFTDYDDFDDYGCFYADGYDSDDYTRDYELNDSDLDDAVFYYDEDDIWDDYDFELDTLTFAADRNADEDTLTFDVTMRGVKGDKISATLTIEIGKGSSTGTKVTGDIIYEVDPDDSVTFDRDDFWDFLDDETGDDLEYVRFTDADGLDDWGELYSYDYDDDRTYFDESDLDDGYFYYDSKDLFYDEDFTLDDLTFVADRDADGKVVELDFTAYGEDGDKAYGTVAIAIGDVGGTGVAAEGGDIRYYTDYSGRVQINANDIARFFEESYPGYTLQYVTFKDAPTYGSLYYNYYGTSSYGSSSSLRITDDNCDDIDFYFSPSSSQHALSELTYIPSGVNYCAQIPFTAYGSGSRSVSGTILISVNLSEVPDVYGPTPRNTAVTFPAASIYTAVAQSSGLGLASIQLLELPATNEGVIYVGSGLLTCYCCSCVNLHRAAFGVFDRYNLVGMHGRGSKLRH